MKIIVTGAQGQLGYDLVNYFSPHHEVTGIDINECDITNEVALRSCIEEIQPHYIIHPAAYTAVDTAEHEPERAYKVNCEAVGYIAQAARDIGATVIMYSTDYVFDGKKKTPYKETDKTNPINVYGKTKLEGEEKLRSILKEHFILRISWLCGHHGNNFLKTMLRLAEEHKTIRVVADQVGTPTFTRAVTVQTAQLLNSEQYGVYHSTCHGSCTWYDFAQAIFKQAGKTGITVTPVSTAEFPTPAARPQHSILENAALQKIGLDVMPDWKTALKDFFDTMPDEIANA